MGSPRRKLNLLFDKPPDILRDDFSVDLAAGTVNGTKAIGGQGTRTVLDTNNNLSISNRVLDIGGINTGGDPRLMYADIPVARFLGRTMFVRATIDTMRFQFGFHNIAVPTGTAEYGFGDSSGVAGMKSLTVEIFPLTYLTGTLYDFAVVLRSTGFWGFIKGGVFTDWTLLWTHAAGSDAILYPGYCARVTTFDIRSNYIRLPKKTWYPEPIASDGFSLATITDGLGHTEKNGGAELTWTTGSTWVVSGGVITNTPTLGNELWDADARVFTSGTYAWVAQGTNTIQNVGNKLVITYVDNTNGAKELYADAADLSSNLIVGKWYTISCDYTTVGNVRPIVTTSASGLLNYLSPGATTASGSQIITYPASTVATDYWHQSASINPGESLTLDNLSMKALTTEELFRTIASPMPSNIMADVSLTIPAGGVMAGMVICLDNATNAQNYLLVYHDGISYVKLDKCLGGVYSNLISGSGFTYVAGATLRIVKNGASIEVYYNNVRVGIGATLTSPANDTIINGTLHGIFSTASTNTLDNFVVWPLAGGAHNDLDGI